MNDVPPKGTYTPWGSGKKKERSTLSSKFPPEVPDWAREEYDPSGEQNPPPKDAES